MAQEGADLTAIEAIGVSYQMHGLVIVDKEKKVFFKYSSRTFLWRIFETARFFAMVNNKGSNCFIFNADYLYRRH